MGDQRSLLKTIKNLNKFFSYFLLGKNTQIFV